MEAGAHPLKSRQRLEELESLHLAPWAQASAATSGRRHPEPPHPFRTAYQRDRARIIHSRAFRRLAYKTQVFLSGTGDHLRTRLTHTIEVASVGRTIASALGANEDLVECIALAHDLGHSPFGHCGEACLDRLMQDHGGFEHNLQSLRIVERLERKYPGFPGLNLSLEVLEGLDKGGARRRAGLPPRDPPADAQPSLEAQIADLADEITYYSHDLDDGLDHGLIHPRQLEPLEIWRICRERVHAQFPGLAGKGFLTYAIRSLIDFEVADTITETRRRLAESGASSADDVRRSSRPLAAYGEQVARANQELRQFLRENLYFHSSVIGPNERGCRMIEELFTACLANPSLLPADAAADPEAGSLPVARRVCDAISAMTDRFLETEHARVCHPRPAASRHAHS